MNNSVRLQGGKEAGEESRRRGERREEMVNGREEKRRERLLRARERETSKEQGTVLFCNENESLVNRWIDWQSILDAAKKLGRNKIKRVF